MSPVTPHVATRRILVVDDEANARVALAELLRDEGFEVETAVHGFDALSKLGSVAPHVVITDLQMPGMEGSELVARLLQGSDPPSVIVMTSFGEIAAAVAALRAGASNYVTKPIHFDELLLVLGKVIEHHDLEREVDRLRAQDDGDADRAAVT
ncbi:MAG: sigma-54 dependent DNA-binding response regulator [Deltaproteobacteria bacterium]|nr:sigma-54 dependent DNA-binding response regulator [Deltaproteobacteria bacterium]